MILYKNTGKARATKLVIHRKVDGADIAGFPIEFNMLMSIPGYVELTLTQFKLLSDAEYATRRDAFIVHAAGITGYTAGTVGSVETDTISCPIDGYVMP